ncbi:MAG: hypothetical protein H7301_09605 [Cryobacterium sp.]|nr:hypothetical protein [Oligoflexia bacterium]
MTKKNSIKIQNLNNSEDQNALVDVLYQKMGDRWYAFSMVGEEVFVGSVSESEINQAASEEMSIETVLVEAPHAMNEVA